MPQTLQQFGQTIKAKHPEYADMADEDVASKVLAKYPEYHDMVAPAANKPSPPPQQGFFGSALDASGLSSIGHLIAHPVDTIKGIPQDVSGIVHNTTDNVRQGLKDFHDTGLSETTRRDFGRAVPIVGPTLATAQGQHDAGNDAGMAGTLAGTVAGAALPEAAGGALKAAGSMAKLPAIDPAAAKLAATRVLAPGNAGQVLARALKPGVQYGADVVDTLNDTMKPILATKPKIGGLSDFVDATSKAKEAQFAKYDSLRAPHMAEPVDTTPLVRKQVQSIPATDRFETPGIVKATAAKAKPYDMTPQTKTVQSPILGPDGNPMTREVTVTPKKPTLGRLDSIREDTNAKLNSFYNLQNGDQNAALSNARTARIKAVNDGSRNLVYGKLSELTGMPEQDIRDMQNMYGNLSEVEGMAGKREVVFGRHDPVSLAEKVASSHGGPVSTMWNFGIQKGLRGLTDADALVRSAVDRYQNPVSTPLYGNGPLQTRMVRLGNGMSSAGRELSSLPVAPRVGLLLPKRRPEDSER